MLVNKKLSDDLTKCTKAVVSAAVAVRKFLKVPIGEKTSEKAARLLLLKPAKQELVTAEVAEAAKVATVYELFRKGLKEDPELQWDRIVEDMHTRESAGSRACPYGSALISTSSRYTLSMQRKGKGFTCYVTLKSLQSPVFEPT